MRFYNISAKLEWSTIICISIITLIAVVPLFFNLPFRDNIYLSWEGAYRLYKGQVPFKDFGVPLGYAFWILPAMSFHVFGPYLYSLVKVQVVINILSGLSFMYIIRVFLKDKGLIVVSVLLYTISFSFYNFWPWYNHTVVVYEFLGIAFLLMVLLRDDMSLLGKVTGLLFSAFFCFLSLFTKQDAGAFAVLISGVLLVYDAVISKRWVPIVTFGLWFLIVGSLFILPLLKYDFGYWFNYGQPPHYSRISVLDFLSATLGESAFIKFYFLIIVVIVFSQINKNGWVEFLKEKKVMLHTLLTLAILFQAAIHQVTSYVPADSNIYFHSFMFSYIFCYLNLGLEFTRKRNFVLLVVLILFWWSGLYWKYANRMFSSFFSPNNTENVVSSSSYTISTDTALLDKSTWSYSRHKPFERIKIPQENIAAIDTLYAWYNKKEGKPSVLNMSELTPLAEVLGYELEKGTPLWYHLNVGMFDKELSSYKNKIRSNYYDLVLFENIPHLNNFYPFEIREELQNSYKLWFSFQAPREMKTETIEVYIKKTN